MPERKQKKEPASLRTPHPKKLGLSVPPLLRLPHEELIRPQQPHNESPEAQKLGQLPSSPTAQEEELEVNHGKNASDRWGVYSTLALSIAGLGKSL